ncbi:MAG: nucleoside triphosphate pyrophosphatase [Halioglobus sp.]
MEILLASTSPYRQRLLERLQIKFRAVPPDADERALPGEAPANMALRLARSKAKSVSESNPEALVIGSDQVACVDAQILGKPGNFLAALDQLRRCSGKPVHFYTAIALLNTHQKWERFHVERFTVHFRRLSDTQISDYLRREQPFDCAGSFKVEGLGIVLFERLTGDDPSSLEGLPLIKLTELLGEAGVEILCC